MKTPVVTSRCADCGLGTNTADEYYMVKNEVWEQSWAGRRKPWHGKIRGQEILCIGCLEERLGRTLTRCDFTDAPINDPTKYDMSDRLRDRLTTDRGPMKGIDDLVMWAIEGTVQQLPEEDRDRARAAAERAIGR